MELWYPRPDLVQIPGGESLQDVLTRAAHALRTVVERHPDATVAVVAHDSVNRMILLRALELPLARYRHLAQAPCGISRIIATKLFRRAIDERDLPPKGIVALGRRNLLGRRLFAFWQL